MRLIPARLAALIVGAVSLGALSCSEPPPQKAKVGRAPQPTLDWRTAFRHRFRFDPDQSAVIVDVTLSQGFHAYTTGETVGRPMKVTFSDDSDVVADGAVQYPEGKKKKTKTGDSVIVEGQSQIVAKVKLREGKARGVAKGHLRYQVCTEQACDRPKTIPFALAAAPR